MPRWVHVGTMSYHVLQIAKSKAPESTCESRRVWNGFGFKIIEVIEVSWSIMKYYEVSWSTMKSTMKYHEKYHEETSSYHFWFSNSHRSRASAPHSLPLDDFGLQKLLWSKLVLLSLEAYAQHQTREDLVQKWPWNTRCVVSKEHKFTILVVHKRVKQEY